MLYPFDLVRTRLDVTDLDLARKLGVTLGCFAELWDRKGASRYVQPALPRVSRRDRGEGGRAFADAGRSKPKAHLPAQ